MELSALYQGAVESWEARVMAVPEDRWDAPTPCTDWTVRDLVNHVVGEDRWTSPLVHGSTLADVGDAFEGDLLGDDPVGHALDAAVEAMRAVAETLPSGRKVHLSYGDEDITEYASQLAADHLVHAWDVAVATGGDTHLHPDLVDGVRAWFAEREDLYRSAGAIGPRQSTTGDAQAQLLAAFGRSPDWGPSHAAVARFAAAFGRGDVDAIMGLMTEDCVFEATGPAPDGGRHVGAEDVRRQWERLFTDTNDPQFSTEEWFVCGERAVLRWTYGWTGDDGAPGHVRGVDVLRLRDGKVAEKLSYVKG